MTLRLLTYLSPSIPAHLFEALAGYLADRLHTPVEVTFDTCRSGPLPGDDGQFAAAEVDLAFVCASSYVSLTAGARPAVELVGAAWAPTDPRALGQAVYYGDLLATADGPRSIDELVGCRLAYNDEVSLSGYYSLRLALAGAGIDRADVELTRSGSHLRSLELLIAGEVDAAAIDSTVWRRRAREDPSLAATLRTIAALGPHPVQPLVARASLPEDTREHIRTALLAAHEVGAVADALGEAELARFVPVEDVDFAGLRRELAGLGLDGAAVG